MKKRMKMMTKMAAGTMAMMMVAGMPGVQAVQNVLAADAQQWKGAPLQTVNGEVDFGLGGASLTIKGNKGQTLVGKTFHLYKLFYAENAAGNESIRYTLNKTYEKSVKEVVGKALGKAATDVTEYEVTDYVQSLNTQQVEGALAEQQLEGNYSAFRMFVQDLRDQLKKDKVDVDVIEVKNVQPENQITLKGLEFGYYLADEVEDVTGQHTASSLCMVSTANPNSSIQIKSDYPSIIKKIQEDDNRTEIGNDGWNDIADYEIGQTVPFCYESNVPNINGYESYYYAWHDKMDEALTFIDTSVKIEIFDKVDSPKASYVLQPGEFEVVQSPDLGETFQVKITDIKSIIDREFYQNNPKNNQTYGQKVVLRYDATLNEKAALDTGRPGFENDVRLEFSNNPDRDGAGSTGLTPWDTVVCFTYKLDVLKSNQSGLQLEGAKFKLYSDPELMHEVYVKKVAAGYCVMNGDSIVGEVPADAVAMESAKDGTFTIFGLDSGTYYLKETEAPVGYRPLKDPIVLQITANFTPMRNDYVKGEGATDKTLQSLLASAHVKEFLNGAFQEKDMELKTDVVAGSAQLQVINTTGNKLPVTGSSMMLLLIGAGCVLCVVAISGQKKRTEE